MRIKDKQNHQTLKEENEEFLDAQEEKELEESREPELSETQQKKQAQKLHWVLMRLKNQKNKTAKVQIVQVNKLGNNIDDNDDLQERENLMGKNQDFFLGF